MLQALYGDGSKWAIHWSIVLARIDLVSLYFHLLWYHSILRGSIDQKHAKTNQIWRQNSEIHSAFASSRWPPWFPDLSRPYGACVKRGSRKHMFSLSLFRPSWQSYLHVRWRRIQISPALGEQDQSNALYPRANKDNQIPTPCPACPPAGMTLLGALAWEQAHLREFGVSLHTSYWFFSFSPFEVSRCCAIGEKQM